MTIMRVKRAWRECQKNIQVCSSKSSVKEKHDRRVKIKGLFIPNLRNHHIFVYDRQWDTDCFFVFDLILMISIFFWSCHWNLIKSYRCKSLWILEMIINVFLDLKSSRLQETRTRLLISSVISIVFSSEKVLIPSVWSSHVLISHVRQYINTV